MSKTAREIELEKKLEIAVQALEEIVTDESCAGCMENINALDNPEEINQNFRILADRLSKQEKQLKAFLERSKDED